MKFVIVIPFSLKYLANAEYMINSRPVASKATFMILDTSNPATLAADNAARCFTELPTPN